MRGTKGGPRWRLDWLRDRLLVKASTKEERRALAKASLRLMRFLDMAYNRGMFGPSIRKPQGLVRLAYEYGRAGQ